MKNLFDLTGKVAIVVGGSRGLGRGMAVGLANAGATVVIASRGLEALQAAAEEISKETGGVCVPMQLDVTSLPAIQDFVAQVDQKFGRIDVLINGAGINIRKSALDFEEEDWNRVTDTQLKYVFFMDQAVGNYMVKHGIKGRIINIGSLSSAIGLKNMVAYCASKGGIVQLTKALANEWAPYGICVNAIGPGYYFTEMTKPLLSDPEVMRKYQEKIPMGRLGLPEDLASTAVYLSCDASSYVTGQIVYVDGGWLIN
ncbi:glucose 1-dehydrogenase [Flavonifractor plautii]|jgi:2-deoxy-D-gluconate 3-dehydrogenase|uniref:SDR family NAD(P)-dependent oxidoreductase n=1 Tax=Flavonifractor plautii TaxID=292800 RepID=UPI0018984B0E|nr:glucose 1-dehydrogenase [Flavonifractor plautii]MBS5658979.1 glucose 1-dehydrogenase [Oscillibacter sp.]MDB7910303.1 glucose 1-dehydrogenase [Flavonifractor plautii]MDB7913854.1 glucose 1-dehydrogenase [Flavonifractor plautii]